MGEYHDLCLRTDTVLLANVFESFRKVCIENCNLEPSHFYTTPGLAWQACLKKTGVNLKLLLDPDMVLMFEQGIRGGITQSIHRLSSANNPCMGEEYNLMRKLNICNTWMLIIYMVGQHLSLCLWEALNG